MKSKTLIFLIFSFLIIPLVNAEINGEVSIIYNNNLSDVISNNLSNGKINFLFSNDEVLESSIDSSGSYIVYPEKFFCWEGCNIFPKIYLKNVLIMENNDVLTTLKVPYSNSEFNNSYQLMVGIFKSNRINDDNLPLSIQNINNVFTNLTKIPNNSAYSVLWNGSIITPLEAQYTFYLNVSYSAKVWIDNVLILDNIRGADTEFIFNTSLSKGNHNIKLEYITSEEYELPNLKWSFDGVDKKIVPEENILFYSGGSAKIQNFRLLNKASALTYPAISDTYPNYGWWGYNGLDTTKKPVLLVHGWTNEDLASDITNHKSQWYDVPTYLENKGLEIVEVVYNPASLDNRKNAYMISHVIDDIKTYYGQSNIDIVAHSMGGLAVRAYIQDLALYPSGGIKYYNNDIRKLVLIASPMYGTYLANLINDGTDFGICGWILSDLIQPSEATYNMEMGSDFVWDLNKNPPRNGIDYITLVGLQNYPICLFNKLDIANGSGGTDGVIPYRSANLFQYSIPFVALLNFHSTNEDLGSWGYDPTGINNATVTKKIIYDFITLSPGSTRTDTIKSRLNRTKGELYLDADDPNSDPIPSWKHADVLIQFDGISPNRVVLKNSTKTYELHKNLRSNRWFYLEYEDFENFLTWITPGNYSIWYDQGSGLIDSGVDINVFGASTNLKLVSNSGCTIPTDGMAITQNTTFCKGNYYLPNGVTFGANNIILNCNGSTLFGQGTTNGINIFTKRYITIYNCTIQNYLSGITVFSSNNSIIEYNYINNCSSAFSIYSNSINNTIRYNNINIHSGSVSGFVGNYESSSLNVTRNYWGTTDCSIIRNSIYDYYDAASYGIVTFEPFLDAPYPNGLPTTCSIITEPKDGCFDVYVQVKENLTKPGEDFLVKTYVTNNESFHITNISVNTVVMNIDDGDDFDEDTDISDLDSGDDDTASILFTVPYAVNNGSYDIVVTVTGYTPNGAECKTVVNSTVKVQKEEHDLVMMQPVLSNNTVKCQRNVNASITLWNVGQSDENIGLSVYNTALGINQTQTFVLNEGQYESYIKTIRIFNLSLNNNALSGTYNFYAQASYDNNNRQEVKAFAINVEDCPCVPIWVLNTTWSGCDITDHQYKNYYDTNHCFGNPSPPSPISQTCNYCSPNPINTSWSGWNNISCLSSNLMNQSRYKTEYDSNYNSCYLVTGLISDLWNSGNNKTYYEYRATEHCGSSLVNDSDNDGIPNSQDTCPTTYGTYCNGCPQPTCGTCTYSYCPATGTPYCVNRPSSTQCGTDYYEYSCYYGNNPGDDTAKRYVDYHCDGSGSCNAYNGDWAINTQCSPSQYCFGTGTSTISTNFYCANMICNSASDCGTNGFTGQRYCNGNQVWDYNRTYSCNNAGQVTSSCTNIQTAQKIEDCQFSCSGGQCQTPMNIDDITVKVDSKKSSNLQDGSKVSKKAKPGSSVDVEVKISNGYTSDVSLEDISGTATIKNVDDGDDLEEDDDINDIASGDNDRLKFSFEIPKEVKKDIYDMIIEVKAKDSNNNKFDKKYNLKLDVTKDKHNIKIEKAELDPTTMGCQDSSTLSVSVLNMGYKDENEAKIVINNGNLGVNMYSTFELTESPDSDARYTTQFIIPNDKIEGTYPISVKVFSQGTDLMDQKTVNLMITPCKKTNSSSNKCFDSDGENYWLQGYVQTGAGVYQDVCIDSQKIKEFVCENNQVKEKWGLCPNLCVSGACKSQTVIQTPTTTPVVSQGKTCFAFWCW